MASSPESSAAPARHIPDELVEDIFARMPARSVLRCRCLSRAWAAALSTDAFVDHHLLLANRRGGPKLCIPPRSASADTINAWSPEAETTTPLMAVPHGTCNGRIIPYGRPCRGLLLLHAIFARLYFVCNPSAGEVAALPDGRMAGDPRPGEDYASVGLGYDARTRTHKAVRLLYHHGHPAACHVYDIAAATSTGHWRPAATGAKPPDLVHMNKLAVYAQGHLHWITTKSVGDADAIMSFSMAAEVFGRVPPPPGTTDMKGFMITELAGCLCVYPAYLSSERSLDIWLLTDYSTATWELRCRIDPTSATSPETNDFFLVNREVTPLVLTDDHRRVLLLSEEHEVAEYDAASGTLRRHAGPPELRRRHGDGTPQLVPYEESLVSAGRPYEDILFSPPAARAVALVLRRLPARELGRLKLVCRSWRAMIETDRFAASHNAHARETAMASFAAGCHVSLGSYYYYSLVFVPLESCSNRKPPLMSTKTVVRNACHGLVLVTDVNGERNIVHNPVTGAGRNFSFLTPRRCPPKIPEVDDGRGCAGLGYDASREEHVLVRLAYAGGEDCAAVQVWRLRDIGPYKLTESRPPIPPDVGVPPVHVAGKMHWMGEQRRLGILVFDVSTMAFDTMPAPPALPDAGGAVLATLAGKLCVAHSCRETETMSIWAKSAGDEGEWETLHVIDLARWPAFSPRAAELVVPMAVDGRDGRVLLDAGKALGYYDARSTTLETTLRSPLSGRTAREDVRESASMRCRGRGAAGDNNKSMGEEQRQRPSSAMPVAPDLEEEIGIPRCSPEMAVADDDDDKSMGRSGGSASGVGSRGGDGDPRDAARRLVALRNGSSSGGTVRAGRGRGGAAVAATLAGGEKARPTWYGGVGGEEDVVRWRRQDEDGVNFELTCCGVYHNLS
uniref:F-box domain-containing protein n=1 Tax=Oryza nivara TaxID=4536 RepID=A0A0E0JCK4_ORYNI